jgi:transcriptional regulator with XRE-family HTH domain
MSDNKRNTKGNIKWRCSEFAKEKTLEVGLALKRLREERELTYRQMGELLNIDYSGIYRIENGEFELSLPRLIDFCVALNVSFHVDGEKKIVWIGKAEDAKMMFK